MQMPSTAPAVQNSRNVSMPHISILNGPRPSAAVARSNLKPTMPPKADGVPNVLLAGLDDQGKPHASWFGEEQADAAAVAADLMGFAVIDISTEELAAVAAKLPRGKLFESGKAFVPFVKRSVYDQLAKHFNEEFVVSSAARVRVEAARAAATQGYAKASKGEVPLRQPEDWSKLMVGDLVLATDDPEDGWYAAQVIEVVAEDRFRLRWRDYADLPEFTRSVTDIALLHPKHVAA